jgi:uncharacterized protein (TIGR00730 family)
MNNQSKASIGVFCSSRNQIPAPFLEFAYQFGNFLGQKGFQTIYGGRNTGMMRQLREGVYSANGDICAITTNYYKETEGLSKTFGKNIVCENVNERKKLLIEKSDILCYLPGGFGTLDELMAGIHYNSEAKHPKSIIIADFMDYFSPFLNWLEEISNINAINKPSDHFCIARSLHDLEKILVLPNS